jgi:hypothetical protein
MYLVYFNNNILPCCGIFQHGHLAHGLHIQQMKHVTEKGLNSWERYLPKKNR